MKCRRLITVSVLTAGLLACATSPLGRNQLLLMPADQMDEMGSTAYAQMKQEKPQSKNSREVNYVLCVSNAITSTLGGSQQWEVTVFQEDSANAFALPGGKIGVHTGLLKVSFDKKELKVRKLRIEQIMKRLDDGKVSLVEFMRSIKRMCPGVKTDLSQIFRS